MKRKDPRTSNGTARRKIRAYWKAQQLPCALCGRAIDYELPAGHPLSFEVDEIVPVSRGGDPLSLENTQPAHRLCNQQKGNRMLGDEDLPSLPIAHSRRW